LASNPRDAPVAEAMMGLAITVVILRITCEDLDDCPVGAD
jgi:hypothetical protein